jgi:uroporphyrinogen decarboxylase
MLKVEDNFAAKNMERVATAISHQEPDQVPVFLNVNGPYFSSFHGIDPYDYYHSPELMLKAQLALRDRFWGLTGVFPDMSIAPEPSALGAEITWTADGTPWVLPCVKTMEDVEKIEIPDVEKAGYLTRSLYTYRYMYQEVGDRIPVGFSTTHSPWGVAALMRGTSEFMGDVIMNPELVRALLRKTTDLGLMWLGTMQKELPPGAFKRILIWDDLSSFVSLDHFREFILPIYEELYSAFPQCERWYHNDANATGILEGLAESGVQCFHLGDEVDMGLAKETLKGRVALMGNVPPLKVLRNGAVAEVEASVKRIIEQSAAGGGLIIAPGGYMDEGTPEENIEAMIEATARYGTY